MSNALAIATVTQALALLIENNLSPEMDIAVKVETRKPPAEPPVEPTINVFLYQVTPNPSMRHTDLPTRASDGTLLKRPVAALDLHFLISAYGEEAELVGQRLIGCVVRTLHEIPVMPAELIELAAERPYLAGSDLVDSPQRLRFTPTVMDIDETSKLWGMLHQTPYALSVAYQASLVLIEGRERPVPAKQVDRRTVTVLPFAAPGAPVPPGRQESAEPEPEPEPAPAPDVAPKAVAPARKRAAVKTAKAAAKPVTKRAAPARARKGTEAGADDKES
ncbi:MULTISPECIES: DUF4255 domain-containing protein [unclassified Streptomyces]|uniref:DUF4255 domain-containing protein n=1 Tax=unclassified Streptomyces TaxID=2593676 RepID=UPI0029B8F9E0|nr:MULTISPECIES: DUF4255 domain-containing protein [unclassified Streptomyces]MDX3767380.1 DUF4255 domain-containing protein [Streptomyces sp. AK08-01B]MDX3817368.1 DUF4255 domain-containing protein [Streptomyces sp. AK08-01A]